MILNSKTVLNSFVIFHIFSINSWSASVTFFRNVNCEGIQTNGAGASPSILTAILDKNSIQSLKLVQVIHRHGDRSPTETFPTDAYKDEDTYWTDGYGELSQVGRKQMFELGVYLRKRYQDFIKDRYHKYDIMVTSSDKDRTIMSAEATMAGFYPPAVESGQSKGQSWNSYVDWQLVPIHTVARANDSFLDMKAPCPKFTEMYNDFYMNSDFVRNMEKENKELKDFFLQNMGLSPNTRLQRLLTFQDTLMIHRRKNLDLPVWLNESTFQKLNSIKYFQFLTETYTPELKRLRGGPLIQRLLTNMVDKVAGNVNAFGFGSKAELRRRILVYSAHEGTLGALLNSLNIFNMIPPPYATATIFELHSMIPEQTESGSDANPEIVVGENKNNLYYVKILYRNDTNVEPYELEVPGCGSPCTLEKLFDILEPLIPSNWEQECELNSTLQLGISVHKSASMTTVWFVSGGLILALLVFILLTVKYTVCTRDLYGIASQSLNRTTVIYSGSPSRFDYDKLG